MSFDMMRQADQILCGTHATRKLINGLYRDKLKRVSNVAAGERIIALRNDAERGIWNGETRIVRRAKWLPDRRARLVLEDETEFVGDLLALNDPDYRQDDKRARRCMPFDYAYALTVHKSQGSEWNKIMLVDDWQGADYARWLYTGVTRARDKLALVS